MLKRIPRRKRKEELPPLHANMEPTRAFANVSASVQSAFSIGTEVPDRIGNGTTDGSASVRQLEVILRAPLASSPTSEQLWSGRSITDASENGKALVDDDSSPTHSKPMLLISVPNVIEQPDEFDANPTTSWTETQVEFKTNMNRRGTFSVRILRAQRLQCSVGSPVQAHVSLKPWKGKVRTRQTIAFHGPLEENGVCAKWDETDNMPLSMLHAYSSDESPTPEIHLDLKFSPLGVLSFTMARLSLKCEALLMNPNNALKRWFTMDCSNGSCKDDQRPLVQIEAMFIPLDESTSAYPALKDDMSIPRNASDDLASNTSHALSTAGDPSEGHARKKQSSIGEDALSFTTGAGSTQQRNIVTKRHRLTLKTFRIPARCCVCHKVITSGIRKRESFRCEECHVDCCGDCRLHVDIKLPCGSSEAKDAVAGAVQIKFRIESLMQVLP